MALRDDILARWGQYGEWNAGGVDRVSELAQMLTNAGITDLNQLSLRRTNDAIDIPNLVNTGEGYAAQGSTKAPGYQLMVGDTALGFLGPENKFADGYLTPGRNPLEGPSAADPYQLSWSAAGDGNVSYDIFQTPDGGVAVSPKWGSSSDADSIRTAGLVVGGALAAGAGLNALTGAGATPGASLGEMMAASASGPGAGLTPTLTTAGGAAAGGAGGAGGIGTLASLEALPASITSAITPLAPMAPVTMAEMGALGSLSLPTITNIGAGGLSLGSLGTMLKDYGPLAAGVLGAVSGGKDQTQSASREPWAPAQPFLQDVLSRAGGMMNQYMQNPLSPQQTAALNNSMGIVNGANAAVPGLLSNLNAAGGGYNRAGGANRSRVNFTPLQFSGLLGNIPGDR